MTTDFEVPPEKRFVPAILPWAVAAAGLVFYVITLSHWITSTSLLPVARLAGYQWQPVLSNPVYFLFTLPLKLLPPAWLPLGLNLFSALCAAGALGLLARAVALLPHDRTHPQRELEKSDYSLLTIRVAWLPVVFAVLICAFHLAFWERATSGGPEMLDVLLFAYVVRCLLEYRRDARESWLLKAAFVYALGVAENWLLILLLPGFMVSLIWVMGWGFFNMRFLSRAWLLGLAGLSLYFLLPTLAMLDPDYPLPFWSTLKLVLANQKNTILNHWRAAQERLALAALPSLLPMLIIGLRFPSDFGDNSRIGAALAKFCIHALHAALLLFCAWVTLDPPFSATQLGLGPQFLPLHVLAALGAGYFSGYFLLLFGERAKARGQYRDLIWRFDAAVVIMVWVLSLVTVAALCYRNWPITRVANGSILRDYARLLTEDLPAKPAVLLSDDTRRLWLAQASLAQQPGSPKHIPVDTRLLNVPSYHRTLHRQSAGAWPLPPTNHQAVLDDVLLIDTVLKQSAQRDVFYLHPSFGYYFEFLRLVPEGIVYKLAMYSTNDLFAPPLPALVAERNAQFWERTASNQLPRLLSLLPPREEPKPTNWVQRAFATMRVKPAYSLDAWTVATSLSRSANYWGVELQRMNRLPEAGGMFALAEQLNPGNVVAHVNRQFNQNLVAGNEATVNLTQSIEDQFGGYRSWDQVIGENGPFDEPTFCYEQGRVFAQSSLYRQALQQLERARTLAPADVSSRLWLGSLYLLTKFPGRALAVAEEIKQQPERFALTATNRVEFLALEAAAHFALNNALTADRLLQNAIAREPTNYFLLSSGAQVYLRNGHLTNALDWLNRQLRLQPNDTNALMSKGYVCLQLGAFGEAIPTLTRLLSLQPANHYALLNRAIANLQSSQLDAAQADYQSLHRQLTNAWQAHFGLGEVAWRRRLTNDAIHYYTLYLSNAPPRSAESKMVGERLRQLQPAAP